MIACLTTWQAFELLFIGFGIGGILVWYTGDK